MKSIVTALLGAVLPLAAWSQAYPSVKPIRLIVPFAPGGNVDITARTIAPGLGEAIGQTVVVENRTGAGGVLGADAVAKSPADGYTLLMGSNSSVSVAPALNPKNPYHPIRDFAPISLVAATPFVLVAHPSVPANTLGELIALAKAKPGSLTMASGGIGSSNHLVGELFQSVTRTKLLHIPYKGAGEAMTGIISGQVDVLIAASPTAMGQIAGGKIRPLAISGDKRSAAFPGVPTFAEVGLPTYTATGWFGFAVPKGTSKEIVAKLYAETVKGLQDPAIRAKIQEQGAEPGGMPPDQFAKFITDETKKWGDIAKAAGVKPE